MFAYMKSECIRQMKSKRYISSLVLMALSILILFQLFSTMAKAEGYKREESYLLNNDISLVESELYNLKMRKEALALSITSGFPVLFEEFEPIKDFDTFRLLEAEIKIFEEVVKEESQAFYAGDMKTYMTKAIQNGYYILLSNKDYYMMAEEYTGKANYDRAIDIISKYNFPSQEFEYFVPGMNSFGQLYASSFRHEPDYGYFDTVINRILYYDQLLSLDYTPLNMYQVDSISIAYQTIRTIFPVAIPLLVLFLFFDSYDSNHTFGTTKTILSLPHGRRVYVFGNIISNMIIILSILFIPLLIIVMAIGIKDGFSLWNYPILADVIPFNPSIVPSNIGAMNFVYKTNTNGLFAFSHFGLSQVSNYSIFPIPSGEGAAFWGQLRGVDTNKMTINGRLDWISLGVVILRSLPLIFTFTLFMICLVFLINILLEKKMNVLITSSIIFIGLQLLAPFSSTVSFLWINPLQFRNAVYTVTGFTSYPLILGLISTVVSSIILFIICDRYMHKKDIT